MNAPKPRPPLEVWHALAPGDGAMAAGDGIMYQWKCEPHPGEAHSINCLWVWHDCSKILGPTSVAPGARYGWRPAGVGAHTLVQIAPLTITASVIWDCCGRHGYLIDGEWADV